MAVPMQASSGLLDPSWLVVGTLLGAVFSILAAGAFLIGGRLFPAATHRPGAPRTGDVRRRTEIRQYLRAIGEPFAEDYPVEDQPVAFYLPKRDIAITFDARAHYRIDRSPIHAVLVEHEMPGSQLGARLPFETPELDVDDGGSMNATETAFAVLGLPASASAEEVRHAYRRKIKEVHPDHGGDREAFHRVREAYTRAKDRAN